MLETDNITNILASLKTPETLQNYHPDVLWDEDLTYERDMQLDLRTLVTLSRQLNKLKSLFLAMCGDFRTPEEVYRLGPLGTRVGTPGARLQPACIPRLVIHPRRSLFS
jgi:hypothetical protein